MEGSADALRGSEARSRPSGAWFSVAMQHTEKVFPRDAPTFFGQGKPLVALANVSLRHQRFQRPAVVRILVRVERSVVIVQRSPQDARFSLIEADGGLHDAFRDFGNRSILLPTLFDDLPDLRGMICPTFVGSRLTLRSAGPSISRTRPKRAVISRRSKATTTNATIGHPNTPSSPVMLSSVNKGAFPPNSLWITRMDRPQRTAPRTSPRQSKPCATNAG